MTTDQQPIAFPRGKRPASTTPSSLASSAKASSGVVRPSKKRAIVASSSSDTTSTKAAATEDFLFGNDKGLDDVLLRRNKKVPSRTTQSSRKRRSEGDDVSASDDDDDDDDHRRRDVVGVTSQLPLGGGAVLPPSRTPDGKRRIPPRIEALTFAKFARGMKVLGVVREVRDDYAVISLPTMLVGYVVRRDNDDEGRVEENNGGGLSLIKVLPRVNSVMAFYVLNVTTKTTSTTTTSDKKKQQHRMIELSPWPTHVNDGIRLPPLSSNTSTIKGGADNSTSRMIVRGRITSIEPHGCIVNLGSQGILHDGQCAFLKFDNIEGEYVIHDNDEDEGDDEDEDEIDNDENGDDDEGEKRKNEKNNATTNTSGSDGGKHIVLNRYRIYDFTILPPSNMVTYDTKSKSTKSSSKDNTPSSVVQLGLPSIATLASLRTNYTMMPSLSSLQPGMLTEVRVEAHARNGLCVSFGDGGVYRGSIDEDHLGGHRPDTVSDSGVGGGGVPTMWWRNAFTGKRAKFTARIIAIDATMKIVRFSLNPHILALDGKYSELYPHAVGTIINNARVIRVDPGIGALLALPSSSSSKDDVVNEKEQRRWDIAKTIDTALSNHLLDDNEYLSASRVCTAYVHISKSMDNNDTSNDKKSQKQQQRGNNTRTPEALFARHFALNARIKSLRILSTNNLFDGIASCATAKSIVEAHVLTHADIVPGKLYVDVTVLQLLESGGVLVDLGVGTRGIVPSMHLFDKASHGSIDADGALSGYRSKIRQTKYKVGNLISVRCLTVDVAGRQCVLTAKKTLLSNDISDPIVDYPSIVPGRLAAGFISKVDDTGLTVTFYNNVHGRVSSRSLAAELGVEDPKLNYNVGDVVAARVVDCVRRRDRRAIMDDTNSDVEYYYQLILSLKTVVDNETTFDEGDTLATGKNMDQDSLASAVPLLAAGSLLMPKRMKVLQLISCLRRDDGFFLPGYAVVSIKSKFFTGSLSTNSGGSVEFKLPFDQLMDSYGNSLSSPPFELDQIAQKHLTVGKRIDAEGLILSVPNGADGFPVVSLRPSLVDTIKKNGNDDSSIICPSLKSNIFMGVYVRGYVTRIDSRFGAFVRFLDGLTGLIPKLKKGLDEKLYDSILCKVTALDITSSPPKILLKRASESEIAKKRKKNESKNKVAKEVTGGSVPIQVGDIVGDVKVLDMNFARMKVVPLNNKNANNVRARIHVTMASAPTNKTKLSKKESQFKHEHKIGKSHPFYEWKVGDVIPGVRCVAVDNGEGVLFVEFCNMTGPLPQVVGSTAQLSPGCSLSAIVTSVSTTSSSHHGLWVQVCPGISGFISALELSANADVLNNLQSNYKVGNRITCCVVEGSNHSKMSPLPHRQRPHLQTDDHDDVLKEKQQALDLSVLMLNQQSSKQPAFSPSKPQRGDVVVGRINTKAKSRFDSSSLMLILRGNISGRCCITELADVDNWDNMPLGNSSARDRGGQGQQQQRVVSSDSDAHEDDNASDDEIEMSGGMGNVQNDYPECKYINCRVLGGDKWNTGMVEVSLRDSRLKGNMDDDRIPNTNETANAYVVSTTSKGCFVRLSRLVEGRVILKELSDDFIPNPSTVFPPGRLIVGKVKNIKESHKKTKKGIAPITFVDMDLRESVLLASGDRVTMDDVQENLKYTGVITRVESYGVFVRIDNSDISGLAHVSECSDNFIKNIFDLYNPGDFVKVKVLSLGDDKDQRRLAFSLKASNFMDDSDSDNDSKSSSDPESSSDEIDKESDEGSDDDDDDDEKMEEKDSIDSEDEDFAAKLAQKMEADEAGMDVDEGSDNSSEGSSSDSEADADSDDSDEEHDGKSESLDAMDTNVGFDWGGPTSKSSKSRQQAAESSDENDESSENSDNESDDDDDNAVRSSRHKGRKNAATKKREEEETSRRETALADGTADETPENATDFERLVASSPNSAEVWIKYMAFFLSLADIDSARNVAKRAFERIEFRQEGEKLNVWTALLTLELKYGTNNSLQDTVDHACRHNNPKQVYLRVCELLDKEVDAAASGTGSSDLHTSTKRADEMFKKMCKKFKNKKSVWVAHFQYLLKGSRHEEAHTLLKRSLLSLCQTKHVEVMSKFAQMEFELGSPERGRTIFNALLQKHPKRMDLLFVSIDKEVKIGDITKARSLFDSVVHPVSSDRKFKFSDKQMKSLFKKWYRMEEEHGDAESQDHVKDEARAFVAKSNS